MASDLRSTNEYPLIKTISCGTTTTQIKLPSSAKSIRIISEAGVVYICQNGATDGGALPSDFYPVVANESIDIPLGTGQQRRDVYIASKTGTIAVNVMLLE